jgi:uncharacterized protein YndB with AHSA1/START domain
MLKVILIVVACLIVVVAAILGFAATKPNTFRVQRTASIKAAPEKVFAYINDFHSWGAWSPYEKLDPAMKKTLSGAASGKGTVYEWEGNSKAGKGRMEITESSVPNEITIQLDFMKPFEAHNFAEFTMVPNGDVTEVTWAMRGPNLFVGKVMSIFLDMDNLIGKDFETGLANLKALTEK